MVAVQPILIYAGVSICQIFYHDVHGSFDEYQNDKYQNISNIQPSLLFKELKSRLRAPTRNKSSLRHRVAGWIGQGIVVIRKHYG